jgi:hypothetical protein
MPVDVTLLSAERHVKNLTTPVTPAAGPLASGFRLAAAQLDRLDTKSAFDLEE